LLCQKRAKKNNQKNSSIGEFDGRSLDLQLIR